MILFKKCKTNRLYIERHNRYMKEVSRILSQRKSSFVVIDRGGVLLRTYFNSLQGNGYSIEKIDITGLPESGQYNPFCHINTNNDIVSLSEYLMKNSKSSVKQNRQEELAETALLQACLFRAMSVYEKEKTGNLEMVFHMLNDAAAGVKGNLDTIFTSTQKDDLQIFANRQYELFKEIAGVKQKQLISSCADRLQIFGGNTEKCQHKDNLNLLDIGQRKTALFIILPEERNARDVFVGMIAMQIMETERHMMSRNANEGSIKFLLNDFLHVGCIPKFQLHLQLMEAYCDSAYIYIDSVDELKRMYSNCWQDITENCEMRYG